MIDSHTHSAFSADSETPLDDLIEKAIELGLEYLAVTDHMDRDFIFCKDKPVPQLDFPKYAEAMLSAKSRYSGKIRLAFGIECGYSSDSEKMTADKIRDCPLDVVINSVHTVDNQDIYLESYYKGKTKDEIFLPYINAVEKSLSTKLPYDIIGHLGYIARKAPFEFRYADYDGLFDRIFEKMIQRGKCLEINSHVKYAKADFFPGPDLVKRYRELGGELLTFSSDAHQTVRVAEKYGKAAKIALSAGFKYFAGYMNRKPEMYRIEL